MYTEIFKNVYKVVKTQEGYLASRFTEKQLEHYKNQNSITEDRALDSAGVCLDFYTDAKQISFSYRAAHFSRRYVGFDFYENGIFRKHIEEALDTKQSTITQPLDNEGIKRVTVYVPNLSQITIYDLDIGNFKPVDENTSQKLLFVGDSITQGMVALSPSLAYPSQIARALNAQSLNRGVGAMRFDPDSLDEQDEYDPDMVFTAYGINDIYHLKNISDLDVVLNQADTYFYKMKKIYKHAKIYVLTPIWCLRYDEEESFKKMFDEYHYKLTLLAIKHGFTPVNGLNLVPHDTKYFQDHSVHPADSGFNFFAENLLKAINDK